MKTITICGSMTFMAQMRVLGRTLEGKGHTVYLPDDEEAYYQTLDEAGQAALKHRFIDDHLAKIRASDAVLIANYAKHGVAGYIGPNTLIEIAFAYALNKQIFILHELGEQACKIEVLGMTTPSQISLTQNRLFDAFVA